ncbi:RNA_cap guanine-N2 methyltransferase [Hexamita inflata]|uniref:RNA cap guanine-N2 methyltransferase n=1 Tax=Hexamita inflata TaxID=28002 RepID=A0AA86PBI1_9EUKA|nr:RNA cap guanine-N2 methyltransferase [Hexamita inflata]
MSINNDLINSIAKMIHEKISQDSTLIFQNQNLKQHLESFDKNDVKTELPSYNNIDLAGKLQLIQQNRMNRPGLGDEFVNSTPQQIKEFQEQLNKYQQISIVTGFYILDGKPPAPETDGPSASINLAINLLLQGKSVDLVVEDCCFEIFSRILDQIHKDFDFIPLPTLVTPVKPLQDFTIFIEKVGQNSIGQCLSMRAKDVTKFNSVFAKPEYSFGVGDGGNEIGCGKFKFENIKPKEIKCVIETDNTILCDISNFGGLLLSRTISSPQSYQICRYLLSEAYLVSIGVSCGLIDGVTGLQQISVDGMEFQKYKDICNQIWE